MVHCFKKTQFLFLEFVISVSGAFLYFVPFFNEIILSREVYITMR